MCRRTLRSTLLLVGALTFAPFGRLDAQADSAAPAFLSLRPGDVVRLKVFREPDISGDYLVDDRGLLSVPYLGQKRVAGVRRDTVVAWIERALGENIVNLSVQVAFTRRVPVLGAVRSPGLYPIDATTTIGDLVGLAGGPAGTQQSVALNWMRGESILEPRLSAGRRIATINFQPGDQLFAPHPPWIVRNYPWVVGTSISILVAFLRFS